MRTLTTAFFVFLFAAAIFAHDLGLHQQIVVESAPFSSFALMQDVDASVNSGAALAVAPPTMAPKNRGKAFFMSLLVPGWGQHYAGATKKRNAFLGLEVGMWLTYGGLKGFSAWRQQDYEAYAATHAGVNLEGKNNDLIEHPST